MEITVAEESDFLSIARWRSVLLKRVVNPVFMVVIHVLADEAPQMAFVQCNHIIEKLPAATSDPAFREPVLPGRLHTGALRRQPC